MDHVRDPEPATDPRSTASRLLPATAFVAGPAIGSWIYGKPELAVFIAVGWSIVAVLLGVIGGAIRRRWRDSDGVLLPFAGAFFGGPTFGQLGWGKGLVGMGIGLVLYLGVSAVLDDED